MKLDSYDWKNIFEMRTAKYKSWIEYCEKYPENAVGVRYEDLVENSESFFRNLVNRVVDILWPGQKVGPLDKIGTFLVQF